MWVKSCWFGIRRWISDVLKLMPYLMDSQFSIQEEMVSSDENKNVSKKDGA